ncbi:hypothetical protein CAEBREN_14224 [Caenorhabditis brenneri]|uniref:Uncharacterized protein n=1 Tax=Caenorhabditis brenneri TaxID=135651 RepID=G0MS14_CAEBE|nr:hypothetical protein CAEBREN_14224 [Caenorhabditis brenneri]
MAPTPTATKSRKKTERDKKEEELKLKRLREKQILKKIGIARPYPYERRFKPFECSYIIEDQRCKDLHPPRTEQSIIELLAQPIPGSALNPVTDMSLVKLTVLKLNSETCLPVLDL